MEVQEAAGVPLMPNSMELCSIGGLTGAGAIIGRGSDGLTLAIPSDVVLTISLLVLVRNAGQEGLPLPPVIFHPSASGASPSAYRGKKNATRSGGLL